jgi:hypothetical protein
VNMALLSSGISKGILGAALLSLGFGAVASGRDLVERDSISALNATQVDPAANSAAINRATKTDRAARTGGPGIQTRTVALRLNDFANTSVLIRVPVARETSNSAPGSASGSLFVKSGQSKPTVACEPVVSVLTEVAKRLQPGRCVT